MNEDLLRKIIRIKLDIGTAVLAEMPRPVQESGKKALELLHEELQSCLHNDEKETEPLKKQHSNLTEIEID